MFAELGWYAKLSGLEPNVSKSHAMWIGRNAFSREILCPDIELSWGTKLKLLGVVFTPSCKNITEENITLRMDAIRRNIGMWHNRHLTLIGKIAITKTLLLAQLTHVLSSLPNPKEDMIKYINHIFFSELYKALLRGTY